MTDISIVVAGAGLVGSRHIALAAERGLLSAIVDPASASEELAKSYQVPHFADLKECLEVNPPDGLIVATPNQLHVEHGLLAIAHGVPVLIEKPIASRSADAVKLVDEAENLGVPILAGHHRRHNPRAAEARRCIKSGALGQIVAVNGTFWIYKPDEYFSQDWRRAEGAGPVFINLIHDIDLLRFFCGEVIAVQAVLSSAVRGHEVEDSAAIILEFECGAIGTFSASDTAVSPWSWEQTAQENPVYPHRPGASYRIAGTDGALSIPDLEFWSHPGAKGWWDPIERTQLEYSREDTFKRQLDHFVDVIAGADPLVSGREALRSLCVIEAIIAAARTGARQSVTFG